MRRSFIAVALGAALLSACGKPAGDAPAADKPATAAPPTAILASLTAAPLTKPQALKVMHERHEGMEQVGKTNKVLKRAMGDTPDMAAAKPAAATMNKLAKAAGGWFPAGTGPDLGKTGAKPEIWQKPEDFAAKLKAFQTAAAALNKAAQGGNAGSTTAAYADLGKSCKGCHDSYRKEMKH